MLVLTVSLIFPGAVFAQEVTQEEQGVSRGRDRKIQGSEEGGKSKREWLRPPRQMRPETTLAYSKTSGRPIIAQRNWKTD